MLEPTDFERRLGSAIRANFGTDTKVVKFGDDQNEDTLYIVSGKNSPVSGVTSYGSIGLYRMPQSVGGRQVILEVVAACASYTPSIDNALASCVIEVLKGGAAITYGSTIKNIIRQYNVSETLSHVVFVSPFLWENMHKINVGDDVVHFLLMLPISDGELGYVERNGIDALERWFVEKQIDVFDIERPSAI